ncbi:hypothetical protein ACSN7O_004719 [Enterobacter chuandaensis]
MKYTNTLSLALILCATAGEYAHAADSAQVNIEATINAEYSLSVDTSALSINNQEISNANWKKFTVTTTANTPTGVLLISGCEGEGNEITLRKNGVKNEAGLKFEIVRNANSEAATFTNGEWKINTKFGSSSAQQDESVIWVRAKRAQNQAAGNYTCTMYIKAQAQ